MAIDDQRLTSSELGQWFGKSERTIQRWVQTGILPKKEGDSHWLKACTLSAIAYFEKMAVAARNKGEGDAEGEGDSVGKRRAEAECRIAEARAAQEETKLLQIQGELVRADDVRELGARMVAACKQKLLSLPSAVASQVRETKDPHAAEKLLRQRILEALDELSQWEGGNSAD